MSNQLLTNITILVLAAFVGFEVISKVPNTLHTPLMSGTNAIHGIVLLGGLLLMHDAHGVLEHVIGRVDRRYGPVAALTRLADDPQQLTGLDIGAMPGMERDGDFPGVVADHGVPERTPAFGDVLDLADPSFEGGALAGDQAGHRDHRR